MSAIELNNVTKSFGHVHAVADVTAVALPGQVTALLGPNGAGKTTTLRMLLGLVAPDSGTATFGGRRYDELTRPFGQVGAVLEASGYHPGVTALDHLRVLTTMADLPRDAPGRVPGDGPAAGAGGRNARRPGSARPGRANERPRPTGRSVVARVRASARGRGSHGPAVQP